MFDRLSALLTPIWVWVLAGTTVIIGLSLGYTQWPLFLLAGLIALLSIPLAMWNARKIRKDDPDWRKDRPAGGKVL